MRKAGKEMLQWMTLDATRAQKEMQTKENYCHPFVCIIDYCCFYILNPLLVCKIYSYSNVDNTKSTILNRTLPKSINDFSPKLHW